MILILALCLVMQFCGEKMVYDNNFNEFPVYTANDLGINYTYGKTQFNIWSPVASAVKLNLYDHDEDQTPQVTKMLTDKDNGLWTASIEGDLIGKFYTFQIRKDGKWLSEAPDIYAKAVGVNGKKGMVIDLETTNPDNWENDVRPRVDNPTDMIIYEMHTRDISMHPSSGISNKGKFLGLIESGTTSPDGEITGLDHIKALGITHIHLLPAYDFLSVDESRTDNTQFNWGYDPQNYNTPEGSYATDAGNGNVRIREFKQMVQAFHSQGIGVIMDVVYNHTGSTLESNFNLLTPGYYYRQNKAGEFSDASACGNETASERPMMRNFMLESVKYWATEYHIDGFRFDLMGIHDIETMNMISAELKKIDPGIFVYGEGWAAGASPLPDSLRAIKRNTRKLINIAAFSDDLRDGVKGSWSDHEAKGFVSGEKNLEESIKFGIVASTRHPQVNYKAVNYSKAPWAKEPYQTINYVSCHDNHTLYDKLKISNPGESEEEIIKMHLLSNTIILTSQGVPFIHAGVEMLRTKRGVENSFESPDSINAIDWNWKTINKDVVEYYQRLIQLRKHHPAFRLPNNSLIQEHIRFLDFTATNLVGYQLKARTNGESWENIVIVFNGNKAEKTITIPAGDYKKIIADHQIDEDGLGEVSGGKIKIAGRSALMIVARQ